MSTSNTLQVAIESAERYVHALVDTLSSLEKAMPTLTIPMKPRSEPWPDPTNITSGCGAYEMTGCMYYMVSPTPELITIKQFLDALKSLEDALRRIRRAIGGDTV